MISSFRIRILRVTFNALKFYGVSSQWKEVHQLKKMMERMKNKRKPSQTLLQKGALPSPYENAGDSKRVTSMNKIYMEHITLMLSSGTYGRHFEDLGIELTKVQMSAGLNFLNIYWVARKANIPENIINETLSGALAELQQQMGSMRFMSRVPFLKFVKDLRLEREIELDRIFQSADFGKDFEPTYGKRVITPDFAPKPSEMPEMRQNVLGLDHAKIKGRIMAEILKFKAINTAPSKTEEGEEEEEREPAFRHKLVKFNKAEFLKFYKRRRILALKMKKKEREASGNVVHEYVDLYSAEDEGEDEHEDEYIDEEQEEEEKSRFKR